MRKLATIAILFAVAVAISGCIQYGAPRHDTPEQPEGFQSQFSITEQNIRTPHFVNSVPAHGEVWATTPKEVLINFNFDVRPPSDITVARGGTDVTTGDIVIANDSLSMRVPIRSFGDGEYVVNYHACWPDRTCHDGSFSFVVDSAFRSQMLDLTGQSAVEINMSELSFNPRYVRVSQGTKVTWSNREGVEHFVNTDPHPTHNYITGINSRGLFEGNSFEYTFNEAGEVHYHCSAHEDIGMDAIILVE